MSSNVAVAAPCTEHSQEEQTNHTQQTISLRDELKALDRQRAAVMSEIEESMSFLASTPVGLNEPLIDKDGFPRDDCDLYAVRRARQTVHCKTNDLKEIERNMFEKLAALHSDSREEANAQMRQHDAARQSERSAAASQRAECAARMGAKKPFLSVVSVYSGSPAAMGGISAGHRILQYGPIDAAAVAAQGIAAMARVTTEHEGKMLSVWLLDGTEVREVFVVPQRWKGEGMLGCAFEPVK